MAAAMSAASPIEMETDHLRGWHKRWAVLTLKIAMRNTDSMEQRYMTSAERNLVDPGSMCPHWQVRRDGNQWAFYWTCLKCRVRTGYVKRTPQIDAIEKKRKEDIHMLRNSTAEMRPEAKIPTKPRHRRKCKTMSEMDREAEEEADRMQAAKDRIPKMTGRTEGVPPTSTMTSGQDIDIRNLLVTMVQAQQETATQLRGLTNEMSMHRPLERRSEGSADSHGEWTKIPKT